MEALRLGVWERFGDRAASCLGDCEGPLWAERAAGTLPRTRGMKHRGNEGLAAASDRRSIGGSCISEANGEQGVFRLVYPAERISCRSGRSVDVGISASQRRKQSRSGQAPGLKV